MKTGRKGADGYGPQFRATRDIIRECPFDVPPESRRMIELDEVAELVHDDVINEVYGQKCEPVIEIEIPPLGTASPPRPLVADGDPAIGTVLHPAPVQKAVMNEGTCMFAVREVLLPAFPL